MAIIISGLPTGSSLKKTKGYLPETLSQGECRFCNRGRPTVYMGTIRERVWEIVEVAKPDDSTSRWFDATILTLILLNVIAVILDSVPSVSDRLGPYLHRFEIFSVMVFSVEYLARAWSCVSDQRFSRPIAGRIKFIARPLIIIDLISILPFYLPFVGVDLRSGRVLRLMRFLRVAKLFRYNSSLQMIGHVIKSKKEELVLTSMLMLMLMVFSSTLIYYCENAAQPNAFPNIPSTMWWSVVTLTTVGYGDLYPITALGKFFAAIIAILGVGMFALPVGILGAGFVEAIEHKKSGSLRCPHCGKVIE